VHPEKCSTVHILTPSVLICSTDKQADNVHVCCIAQNRNVYLLHLLKVNKVFNQIQVLVIILKKTTLWMKGMFTE
jgi:hypothetical protein